MSANAPGFSANARQPGVNSPANAANAFPLTTFRQRWAISANAKFTERQRSANAANGSANAPPLNPPARAMRTRAREAWRVLGARGSVNK